LLAAGRCKRPAASSGKQLLWAVGVLPTAKFGPKTVRWLASQIVFSPKAIKANLQKVGKRTARAKAQLQETQDLLGNFVTVVGLCTRWRINITGAYQGRLERNARIGCHVADNRKQSCRSA